MQPNTQPLVIEGANHLILEFLKVGPCSAREILAAAEGAKISERTIQRAAIAIGVVKEKAGFGAGWGWRLPVDDGGTADAATEQPSPSLRKNGVSSFARTYKDAPARIEPSRAEVIAARLRKLEAARGMKGPFYPQDSRIQAWVRAGIRDPDLRDAYERARAAHAGMMTVGIMDKYVFEVMKEAA